MWTQMRTVIAQLRTAVILVALLGCSSITARADVVLDWNAHAARAIVTVGGQVPPRALIRLAMVHLAIYDAVNAIEGGPFESYASLVRTSIARLRQKQPQSQPHTTCWWRCFPRRRRISTRNYAVSLAGLPDDIARANGIAVGQQAASAILSAARS